MRNKRSDSQSAAAVEVLSERGAIMVLLINRSDKSYNADDTKKLALAAMRANTTEAQQKKAGFFTKKSLASATDAELIKLGVQRLDWATPKEATSS